MYMGISFDPHWTTFNTYHNSPPNMGRNAKNKNNFLYAVEYSCMGIRLLSRKRSYPTPLLFNAGEWELYNKSITYFFNYSLKSSLVNSSFNRLMVVNLCFIRKYFSYMKLIYGLISSSDSRYLSNVNAVR